MITAGCQSSPLEDVQQHAYIEAPWIHSFQQFLQQNNHHLKTPGIRSPTLLRYNDSTIMSMAQNFTSKVNLQKSINACRIWLQIFSIAEITDTHGTHILRSAVTGDCDDISQPALWHITYSNLHWPKQHRPPTKAWNIWKKFTSHISKTHSLELRKHLEKRNNE
jgi:hypothetical protein